LFHPPLSSSLLYPAKSLAGLFVPGSGFVRVPHANEWYARRTNRILLDGLHASAHHIHVRIVGTTMATASRLFGASRHRFSMICESRAGLIVYSSKDHLYSTLAKASTTTHLRRELPSAAFSSFSSPLEWWKDRQETKEAGRYKQRVVDMSMKESWTVADLGDELAEAVTSWVAKIPGLSNNKETNMAKEMHKTLTGIMDIVGRDATDETLENMSRVDKLRAAVAGETTVDQVNTVIQQFGAMSLMHRVVRKRRLEGKPIPSTADSMQTVLQTEGTKMMSKTQRDRMLKTSQRMMKKATRR
jgi:hypothetical protein